MIAPRITTMLIRQTYESIRVRLELTEAGSFPCQISEAPKD